MHRSFSWRALAHPIYRRRLAFVTISSGALYLGSTKLHSDSPDEVFYASSKPPLSSLVRAYTVYSLCSIPSLVDYSPHILHALSSVPVLKQITEAFVRVTFFEQFVGGDNARATIPLLRALRAGNKGAILGYSAEVDERPTIPSTSNSSTTPYNDKLSYKRFVDEIIRSIDAAADVEDTLRTSNRRSWVAIKLTALVPAHALLNYSKHLVHMRQSGNSQSVPFPGCPTSSDLEILHTKQQSPFLSQEDINSIKDLHTELERVCTHAQQRGVKVIIDAEYSWYQPAIDALQLSLMRKFNKLGDGDEHQQPLIYGTWQAYLRRNPLYLEEALQDARRHKYSLGVKLVRGAYHAHEVPEHTAASKGDSTSFSISPDPTPPVWSSKSETDECYHTGVRTLVKAIAEDVSLRETKHKHDGGGKGWWLSWPTWRSSGNKNKLTPREQPHIGVMFASHNKGTCDLVLEELVKANLARTEDGNGTSEGRTTIVVPEETLRRVAIAQLYGMADDLTDSLVVGTKSETPLVIKYVPYGALSEVLPYLSRRAIENKSVLGEGGASKERKRAWTLIRARLTGSD
ncbi:hypothetical protein M378DRAFT_187387 [Amanita muscaria Koide BX008]|uniref:Proline dehydrogenase n=1 Tax=Amanita muscaria (strain Koide BX008) TaxID=946122 RepID=A0A0C2SGD3_AMAMK|nr:hypothetical protein M378DRAFT_187387 [Amanita muscaria Koide BX008]